MKPDRVVNSPVIWQCYHVTETKSTRERWTCFFKPDGECTRGWGNTPTLALKDWKRKTIKEEKKRGY